MERRAQQSRGRGEDLTGSVPGGPQQSPCPRVGSEVRLTPAPSFIHSVLSTLLCGWAQEGRDGGEEEKKVKQRTDLCVAEETNIQEKNQRERTDGR